jgi:hypothetical protein
LAGARPAFLITDVAREPCGDSLNYALFCQGRKFTSEHAEKSFLLLGMKRGFLSLHAVNELSDSFGCLLVGYAEQKASVVLDFLVEFGAFVTHSHFRIRATFLLTGGPTIGRLDCSSNNSAARKKTAPAMSVGRRGRQPDGQVFLRRARLVEVAAESHDST